MTELMAERTSERMAEHIPIHPPLFETLLRQPANGPSQSQLYPPRAAGAFLTMPQQARAAYLDEPRPSYLNQQKQVAQAYKAEYVR